MFPQILERIKLDGILTNLMLPHSLLNGIDGSTILDKPVETIGELMVVLASTGNFSMDAMLSARNGMIVIVSNGTVLKINTL